MLWPQTKRTVKLAFPIIMGELAQYALHVIDAMMVGAVSYRHLAAAALVFSVINIPFIFGIGLTMSVSQTVSLANGRGDDDLVSHYLFNGFWVCFAFALAIALPLVFGSSILYSLKQDPIVVELAVPFMQLMSWSIIPMLLFMSLKQFADGLEKTRLPMILSVTALPVNLFLNWLLIYGNWGFPRLELAGAGWGTLLTRIAIFIILAALILRLPAFRKYIGVWREQWHFRLRTIGQILHIGVPSGLQMSLEVSAFAVSAILIGTIDAVSLAAHQIAISCAAFAFMVSTGLAHGGSIRASNNYGRGDWPTIYLIGKSTLLTALVYGAACAVIFAAFRRQIVHAFNNDPATVAMAASLLLYAAIFQISDATQAVGAGLLRGIKDVSVPTGLIAIAYWCVGLPTGILLAFVFQMNAFGMWIGFITGLTFSSVVLSLRFFRSVDRQLRKAAQA